MARPTAVPRIPASASGVSTTRSSPKSFCRPSVIRKTPPSLPMSSPISTTLASPSMARRRPRLRALPMVSVSMLIARLRPRSAPRSPALPAMLARASFSQRSSEDVLSRARGHLVGTRVLTVGEARVVLHELGALGGHRRGLLGVDVVEHRGARRIDHVHRALADADGQLVGLGLDGVEEVGVGDAGTGEVGLEPGDRVAQLPLLELAGQPVAGRVVGGGVRAHPVGERLDERRALALAGGGQRRLGHGEDGEDVVAVDADAGEAEAGGPLEQRHPRLALDRHADRVLVVLAEEDDGRGEGRRPDQGFVDLALAGGAVAQEGQDRGLGAVALHAHGVAGRVQALRPDDDGVEVEAGGHGVPAAVVHAAEQADHVERVDPAHPGDAVLAIGREGHVVGGERAAGTDLGRLLAQQRGPDAELALALQRGGLDVPPADQRQVAVERAQLVVGDLDGVVGVLDPFALRCQQLHQIRLLGKVGRLRPGYRVDDLGRLVQRSHKRTPSPSAGGRGLRRASVLDVTWHRGVVPLTHGDTTTPCVDNTTYGRSAQGGSRKLRTMPISRTSTHVRLSNVPDVDATDARLLLALNEDPRASVMALSQRLGLARNTVQARLARLESGGVLAGFERRVPPEALRYPPRAHVTVQVVQRSLAEVADGLAHIPEVLEVIGLSGVVDLLVEVAATDADDLWRITEQVLAIPGVQRTDTALALRRFVDHRMTPLLERATGES